MNNRMLKACNLAFIMCVIKCILTMYLIAKTGICLAAKYISL